MIDLNDMTVFAQVVDHGGFTAAGRAMGLPKSNISRRITRLERRLGVRLLERTTRAVRTTEIGDVYYRHCKRIEEEAAHAADSVGRLMESPNGLLRVSASVTTGQYLLSPILAAFMAAEPGVRVELMLTNRRVDIIEEGFDLLIRIGEMADSSLISKRLGHSGFNLYASPTYLKARGRPADLADLSDHDCLVMNEPDRRGQWRFHGEAGARSVSIEPRAMINDYPSLRRLVLGGAGIAMLPAHMCAEHEDDGHLQRVLTEWRLPGVDFHAVFPSHRGATPKVRAFLDFIVENLAKKLRTDPELD